MELIEDAAGVRGREVIPRVLPIALPAAGADFVIPVPGGVLWYIQTLIATFASSAVVASRSSTLQLTDGTNVFASMPSGANFAANSNYSITWAKGSNTNTQTTLTRPVTAAVPSVPLFGGFSIRSLTQLIDVGDQWSAIVLYALEVEETPYDVELARDNATLRGIASNAYPQIRIGDS